MAGTIPLSMTQQFTIYGEPLAGGQLFLMVAGTVSTPQNGYQDLALTIPLPNPITLDAAGRIPQFFLADGYIKVRLQDKHGVVQLASDNILVIGPSAGGGSPGATIDATTVFQTGDMKARYSTGVHPGASPGWVRANGLTIGSATSSPAATERGNADCQALFTLLWGADATLVVSSGRGASAAADWAASKTIALPDWRGRTIAGMDDMGSTAANRLTTAGSGINGIALGASGGLQNQSIAQNQLPNIVPTFSGNRIITTLVTVGGRFVFGNMGGPNTAQTGGGTGVPTGSGWATGDVNVPLDITPAGTITSINGGVGQVSLIMPQPTMIATIYIKL